MSYPKIYCFELSNDEIVRAVVCVSMSEEEAIEKIRYRYPNLDLELIDTISTCETGIISEICAFDR